MKKLSLIALACMMVLGLAQCKKNEPTNNNTADNGNRVSITLTLDNGGQRVHPEEVPETGWAKIVYDNNDVVYVGSGGKYMGYLTYNGSVFTGSINAEATVGQPLQFILMGGQDFHGSLTENSTTEYTFNIGNQSDDLAVISCAASNENFSATKLDYTATLRNKCALVKFVLGEHHRLRRHGDQRHGDGRHRNLRHRLDALRRGAQRTSRSDRRHHQRGRLQRARSASPRRPTPTLF